MSTAVVATSRDVMARHARSFRWASLFLPPQQRDDAAVVYALCRLIDDLADETGDAAALDALEGEVRGGPARPLVGRVREVLGRNGTPIRPVVELIEGVRSDLGTVRLRDDRALLRYAYRVAGTVGLMMCGVIGARDPVAWPFAVDLGVAMQLTNICRDVAEDAARGRVYLPARRLLAEGVTPEDLVAGRADRAAVSRVVGDVLDLADRYYASADRGMRYIPARSRVAILVASRVYRAIGVRLRANGCDALAGRTVVGRAGKLRWTLAALAAHARLSLAPPALHDPGLHGALAGLPGADGG